MVIGDMRKYLSCLISIKEEAPGNGIIDELARNYLANKGADVKTIKEAIASPAVKKIIAEGIKRANAKAISRAQHVQEFRIISEDFSVDNGMLTPTLKLKRKEVNKKYAADIESMYETAKL